MPSTVAATAAFLAGPFLGLAPGSQAPARPRAAAPPGSALGLARGATPASEGQGSAGRTLTGVALGLLAAAAGRRSASRRETGRVVVFGRNFECNIKKKKGPAELKKAKVTAKHLNKIILSVRENGPDEEMNPTLTRLIKNALKENVPRSTIDNRIKKFVEEKEAIIELSIGGYGPGGTALLVECVTDNNIRTRTEVKEAFKEANGRVGNDGCVDHLFTKEGHIMLEGTDEEAVMEAALEGDAEVEDVATLEDGNVKAITLPENLSAAAQAIADTGMEPASQNIVFEPMQQTSLNEGNAYEMKRLIHILEECDDVNQVHHNAIIPEETMELVFNNYGQIWPYERALKEVKK